MNKKSLGVLVGSLIMSLLVPVVSAQIDLRQGGEQIIELVVDLFEPFFQVLLGGEDYTGLLLFERFLVFILLLSVISLALRNIEIFDDNRAILWIVSVIVPLAAVRFINFAWLNTILISYQVLGIAIAGILPFVIFFFFLHGVAKENPTIRKIGWIFFIILYFGLWATNDTDNYAQIYFWTMLIALIFLIADGSIHKFLEGQKWKESEKSGIRGRIAQIDKEIANMDKSSLPQREKDREIKRLMKERKNALKRLARV